MLELIKKLLKKAFLIIVAIITYYQFYEYIVEKIPVNLEVTNLNKNNGLYETTFVFSNANFTIERGDFIKPIEIILSNNITQIVVDNKERKAIPKFKIEKNKIYFDFDLLNKNELIKFKTLSKNQIEIKSIDFRIKNIENINLYHYIKKPKPLKRLTNFWLIIFGISMVLFLDALLIIIKDNKLTEMKYFVRDYPLTEKNKYDFLEKYRQLYKDYKVRFKFSERFLIDFKIKNLLEMYERYSEEDIAFIKYMININTEISTLYRTRTIFVIISPILFITAIIGVTINYVYYDIEYFKNYSLNDFNIILLRIILTITIILILFPRKIMNYLIVKRKNQKFVGF